MGHLGAGAGGHHLPATLPRDVQNGGHDILCGDRAHAFTGCCGNGKLLVAIYI